MKFRTAIFALLAITFLATLFAEPFAQTPALNPEKGDTLHLTGANQYGAVTLSVLKGAGLIKLNGTTVETVDLSGSLISHDADIGALHIIGEANLKDTVVKNSSSIMGSFQATRSTFHSAVTLLGQKAVFTASHFEAITVQKDGGYKGKQILELRQGTIINGPVHFESGKGEVILFPGCQVLGTVTGGKIVKKNN